MVRSDEDNKTLVEPDVSVDELNSAFYSRFPFPWPPTQFHSVVDARFAVEMLSQDLGDYGHRTLPENPRIWVAGCGTNQAIYTALRFPAALVLGSDLSEASLEICASTARELGIENLELQRKSINEAAFEDEFDFVICTGVIHHNADPASSLKRLARAVRRDGVLELMVYNRYHRIITTAFQKAVRILAGAGKRHDFEAELAHSKRLVTSFPCENLVSAYVEQFRDCPESMLADSLLQPVEFSYTVESFRDLAAASGLAMVCPCYSIFHKAGPTPVFWETEFPDSEVQRAFEALPDVQRWQVTNLLLLENSPMLWFYFRRQDCGFPRRSEREVCEDFMGRTFARTSTRRRVYVRESSGSYRKLPSDVPFPAASPATSVGSLYQAFETPRTAREAFESVGMDTGFARVNRARIQLTTSAYPYLRAVEEPVVGP